MYPPSKALVKHMPTLDNKNGSSTYCNGGGNALANMSSEAIYENCDRYADESFIVIGITLSMGRCSGLIFLLK